VKRALVAAAAAALLSACASRPAERYFVLERSAAGAQSAVAPAQVVIAPTAAASFYDTQDIVYSRAAGTRAYYRYSRWTERPERAVQAALSARLGAAATGRDRPVLETRLEEIYHDAAAAPGTARLTLDAALVDPSTHAVIARQRFTRSAPAPTYDADGAVAGLRQALGAVVDDVARWVEREVSAGR
jgi:ABC-type uncharacterized transport system auxiliary subunit